MTGLRPNSSCADFKASSDFNPVLATDVYSPNGTVASVKFYAGTGTSYLLGTATYADDNGNWTIDFSPSSLGGATTVTIVAADSEGVTNGSSGTTFSISPVSLGQITVDTGDGSGPTTTPVYSSGTSVSISVASVLTTNSGATIAGVKFYLDTSGTGIYNPATVQLLTGSLASNSTGGFTLSGVSTSGWIGDQTIFAVAYDSAGAMSCPQQDQTTPVADNSQRQTIFGAFRDLLNKVVDLASPVWKVAQTPITYLANGVKETVIDQVGVQLWNFVKKNGEKINWKILANLGTDIAKAAMKAIGGKVHQDEKDLKAAALAWAQGDDGKAAIAPFANALADQTGDPPGDVLKELQKDVQFTLTTDENGKPMFMITFTKTR